MNFNKDKFESLLCGKCIQMIESLKIFRLSFCYFSLLLCCGNKSYRKCHPVDSWTEIQHSHTWLIFKSVVRGVMKYIISNLYLTLQIREHREGETVEISTPTLGAFNIPPLIKILSLNLCPIAHSCCARFTLLTFSPFLPYPSQNGFIPFFLFISL